MRGGGYALDVPPEAVDVHRFEQLVAEGRAAASARRSGRRRSTCWPRPTRCGEATPWPTSSTTTSRRRRSTRLTELRLEAIEERLDAELQLGRPGTVAELESLVAAHPLRERLRASADVGAVPRPGGRPTRCAPTRTAVSILGEELGLDPGPELRRLEAAILAQDPSLDAPRRRPWPQRHAGRDAARPSRRR